MSSPRHDLEEPPAAADEPAITIPASPPRRDPVEDADASFTRKRPRLDSGSNSLRAMSAGQETPAKDSVSPHDKQVKMTIRPHPASSPIPAGDEDDGEADATFAGPLTTQAQSPLVIAIDEDDTEGPPVVAIDDDDEPTSFLVHLDANDHFHRFPFSHSGHYSSMVRDLTQHIRSAANINPTLFPALTEWLTGLPDPSIDMHGFYVSKASFWDDFANLVDKVLARRYQWLSALAAGNDNDLSRFPFGESFDDLQTDAIFCDFLSAYVRACSYLISADVRLISRPRSEEIYPLPLLSHKHVRHLCTALRQEKTPVFHMMRKEYAADTQDMSNRLHEAFLAANGAQNLLRLTDEAFHHVPMTVQNGIAAFSAQLFSALGWAISDLPEGCDYINRSEFHRGVLLFFHKYSSDLLDLSRTTDSDVARDIVLFFSSLLSELCRWDEKIATQLVDESLDFGDPNSPTTSPPSGDMDNISDVDYRQDPVSFPALVANAWKLKVLRKYVIKGNMGMRVMSMATMDSALVEIWREYSNIDPTCKHPVMQYLADFLIHGQVVEYIISVDSHPQLIARSGNILGFLVVTHRWSDKQADAIWSTVSESPDPGVVTATMTMLRSIVGLMGPVDQLYLCQKLYELPVDHCTVDIFRFLRDLSGRLADKSPPIDYAMRGPNAKPWNVCIRMMIDTAPTGEVHQYVLNLHVEASDQLRALVHLLSDEERYAIYRKCGQLITENSTRATGSVRVVYILAIAGHAGDGFFFQQNEGLTRQILDELPLFVQKERTSLLQPSSCMMLALRYRLELLAFMVCRAGPAVPADLYEKIWNHTVGKDAASNEARDYAWTQFLQTLRIAPDNEFCKRLVSAYMPKMDPGHYTSALFDFVANYNFPTTRQRIITDKGEETVLKIPGDDLLWSMVLRSPQGTIEDRAARLLAARYVQIKDVEGVTLSEVEEAHVTLVEKCMQEIRLASKLLRNKSEEITSSMELDSAMADTSLQECELRLGRILFFQKLLLEYIRQKPELNRGRRADSKVDEADIPYGDAVTIRFQCGNERQSLMMGAEHTLDDLHKRLCHATGFTKINLFAKGKRLDVTARAHEKISAIDFGGQLLIQRAEGAEVTRPISGPMTGSSAFETTVVKYFDELFALMDSDDSTSHMIYDFLSALPSHTTFVDGVETGEAQSETLFPPGKFCQARYVAHALQVKLGEQIRASTLNEKFLANAVHQLDQALLNTSLISDPISSFQELRLAAVLVSTLLEFLRERPSAQLSATYFSDGPRLADRLIKILLVALEMNEDATVAQDLYAVIIEASLHSRAVWEAFTNHQDASRLHHALLLADPRQCVRQHVARKVASVCGGDLPFTCPLTKGEIASSFWSLVSAILPRVEQYPEQAQQLFEISEQVFRANDEYDRNEDVLRSLLVRWGRLLLNHAHKEFVGRDEVDHVVLGFSKLLLCCILSIKSFKKPLNAGDLMEQVFKKYIFVQSSTMPDVETEIIPILESQTRQELYDLMLALVDDRNAYSGLIRLTGEIENDHHEPQMAAVCVDRSMEIRSSTGYVGLYNPRAICYMNSLMTQLFMNLNFRHFFLGLEVQEASGSQKLLFETQRLFTQMQNSYRRSTDPRGFAACVKSLEQTPIDVSIQMDVDEFYNLLFDQWEAQLVKEEHKQRFRSFYGGQTLNQIKSKECDHVSERTEPFFAVQCDVMGKANLQESLQAFVRGDVMEGDNKYKCEACGGKFVDAVKRTCFKDVPDNLIFHLKRFEFDLNDFSRRKINDHFEFPRSIDISAYHVDHLSDPSAPSKEDMFDLVGVLVHTGTCENGHYYSYIRERPGPKGSTMPSWVEFDDSNVGPFDPAEIAPRAFGGFTDDGYTRQTKPYSAYMLFYERRAAMDRDQRLWVTSTKGQPLRVPVPQILRQDVDDKNDLFIQEYCRFDPSHSRFVRQLHATSRTINHGTCSEDHEQETSALRIVLAHLGQIVWRQQTSEIFAETINQLHRSALSCSICCNVVLKTIATDEYPLINLLVRCMHAKVRSQTRAFLVDCLKFLREKEPTIYGIDMDGLDHDTESESLAPTEGVLANVVAKLRATADQTYMSTRGWDDFYLTLTQIVEMGHVETAILLNHGFLEFCSRLFVMHTVKQVQEEYYDLSRIMIGKRTGIFNRLIGCLTALLARTDPRLPNIALSQNENRQTTLDRERLKFPLSRRERQILFLWDNDLKAIAVLDKVLENFDQTQVDHFYPGDIVKWMLGSPDVAVQANLFRSIAEGVALDPPFCDAYIQAALSYCEACPVAENVVKIITAISKAIATSNTLDEERAPGGDAILEYFTGLLNAENDELFKQRNPYIFHHYLMVKSRIYAVPLLMHTNESVRKGTHAFLTALYDNSEELPHETMLAKWKSVRGLIAEMTTRIAYEKDAGILRSHLSPLIATYQVLIQILYDLSRSEDAELEQYKDANDTALFYQYRTEVEPRLRAWPYEMDTPLSTVEHFDQSDYGSESDDGAQDLPDV